MKINISKKRVIVSVEEILLNSYIDKLYVGHITKSIYKRITISKTNLSLNK